ncbi:conserved protein, unknown function, partial [Hepatocystis sp. ex Piliocolobus tephrosceles]
MVENILYDIYRTSCCFKTIQKINKFVYQNKEKINPEESKILNENKYVSHLIAILATLGIQTSFLRLKRFKFFTFRPFLPTFLGII